MDQSTLTRAANLLKDSRYAVAFTGAGVSVESGIPPFRGVGGLWSHYDPASLEISFFHSHPRKAWEVIKEIFYDGFEKATPNPAHLGLARLEGLGLLKAVVTQNIDNLHQSAGSRVVLEYHGTTQHLTCQSCSRIEHVARVNLHDLPPTCRICGGILKPDFVFFGEPIPERVHRQSMLEAQRADVLLVIGTTGEVMPAGMIPHEAKLHGASIIEINPDPTRLTEEITDVFIQAKAGRAMTLLLAEMNVTPPA